MKIVCFGDSLTTCGGENGRFSDILQDRFPAHQLINKGVGGDSFAEGLLRLETDVLCLRPDIVLIEFGANDWWRNERPPKAWVHDLETIVSRIQAIGGKTVILGVFGDHLDDNGSRISKEYGTDKRGITYRSYEQSIAEKYNCPYISNIQERIIGERRCWLDMNHPNEFGNRYVADTIEPVLAELLSDQAVPVRKPNLETLSDLWNEAVSLSPDNPAVVSESQHFTYGEADKIIRHTASNLMQASGTSKPKVAVFSPNCIEYYFVYWAVACMGGVIIPLNTWLKKSALTGILANIQPDIIIIGSPNDTEIISAAGNTCIVQKSDIIKETDIPLPCPADRSSNDVAIIMHTSGTTATPKGAVMRHSDLMFNMTATINAHQFCDDDIHLLINPMFHCTALYSSLPTAAYTKTPIVISSPTKPDLIMDLIQRECITTVLTIPSVLQQILKLKNLDSYDTSYLRLIAYAGSAMPIKTINKLRDRFPDVRLHNFFGLTETISMTHVLNSDEAEERPDSIGRLLPFIEAHIVDKDGKELPANQTGELIFARENVITGYYNKPEHLEKSIFISNGKKWFHTGDMTTKDKDGYFFIKGRKKAMIIVGGENVYSAEIEALLMTHDKVCEAAVKGIPATGAASFLGEQIEAFVVATDDTLNETELRRYCFEQLPSYKVPRRITFMSALPRNPAGKVLKEELK
ncbi:MAG: AMP-binding protein [Kiritimatiellae bacterium]|nr:AMP-binding protein [Kiritimatiellia bacterium]